MSTQDNPDIIDKRAWLRKLDIEFLSLKETLGPPRLSIRITIGSHPLKNMNLNEYYFSNYPANNQRLIEDILFDVFRACGAWRLQDAIGNELIERFSISQRRCVQLVNLSQDFAIDISPYGSSIL